MKDAGKTYFLRGIRYFKAKRYMNAVHNWIQAYELGYEKKQIIKNLYKYFILPNEAEFQENYAKNHIDFTNLAYHECTLEFIGVGNMQFYIFDKINEKFYGLFSLDNRPVYGENEVFDSILYTSMWDIRKLIPEMKANYRPVFYLLLEESENKFASFFKLPSFKELYLENVIVFHDRRTMQLFFEQNEEFYLPKQLRTTDQLCIKLIHDIHQNRILHMNTERSNIFLSICIPEIPKRRLELKLTDFIQKCIYDSEIEIVIANHSDSKNTYDARIRYFTYEEQGHENTNKIKALLMANGTHQILVSADNSFFWEQLPQILNFIKIHCNYLVFEMREAEPVIFDTQESFLEYESLRYLLSKAIHGNHNLFECLFLKEQYTVSCFHHNILPTQQEEWSDATYIFHEMQSLLELNVPKIPIQQRNQDLIIMASTRFLGHKHAPTRILLELSRILEIYLKKKVFLLSAIEEADNNVYQKTGLKQIYRLNSMSELTGNFQYPYKECVFTGYQIIIRQQNISEMRKLMQELYSFKPYCIWCIGGFPAFASVMKQFTTMLYTKCVEAYPEIPADISVNYFERTTNAYPQERKFLIDHGIKVHDIRIGLSSYVKSKGFYQRSDFSIPEDAFCIGIVGNRLESDCTNLFLDILRQTIQKPCDKAIWLIFIGRTNKEFQDKIIEQTKCGEHIRFLGYCAEFADAIALIDLLAATPALGNGGAGVTALNEGKPVVSLEVGDIASCVGNSFQCKTLAEFPELIHKYIENPDFYKRQSKKAVEVFQSLLVDDATIAQQLQNLLEDVKGI